jgi:LPXTG-motif cell wall-anchored protein
MYWSVIGLYGALVAETLVRIPKTVVKDAQVLPIFYNLVGVGVFLVMGVGYYFFFKKRKKWSQFEK